MMPVLHKSRFFQELQRNPIGAALLSLAGDSAVYLTGGLLIGLGNVVLVPLYTRCLAPREFGVYALVDVIVLMLVAVTSLKLDVSYLKWFAEVEASRRGELLGSTLLTGLAAAAIGGTVLSVLVAGRMGEVWLHTSERNYAWLLLPIVVLENLQALLLTDLRARRRAVSYSSVAIIRLGVIVAASSYFLVVRDWGLPGLFLGRLAGDAAGVFVLGVLSIRRVAWRISFSLIRPMLRFGLPLVWSVFAVTLQDASGRYYLSRHGTLEEVGLLGAAIKVGAVFQMFVAAPFGVAWGGVLFQIGKQRDAQAIYAKIFSYVFVLALGAALVLSILGPSLFRIFTAPAYYPAIAVLPLVLLVRAMNVIEQPAATGIYLTGRTTLFAGIYTAALLANFLLLHELVPRYGVQGVGWAWLLSSACVPLLELTIGQRFYSLVLTSKLFVLPVVAWIILFLRPAEAEWQFSFHHLGLQMLTGALVALGTIVLLASDFRRMQRVQSVRE